MGVQKYTNGNFRSSVADFAQTAITATTADAAANIAGGVYGDLMYQLDPGVTYRMSLPSDNSGYSTLHALPNSIGWIKPLPGRLPSFADILFLPSNGIPAALSGSPTNLRLYDTSGINPTNNWGTRTAIYAQGAVYVTTSQGFLSSTDGIRWTSMQYGSSISAYEMVYANGYFVAAGYDTSNSTPVMATSVEGTVWTKRTAPAISGTYTFRSIAYGNGTFVSVGDSAQSVSSTDGITWTARTMPSNSQWRKVVFGNGVFVAQSVSPNSPTATSTDGITWTSRTPPNTQANRLYFVNGYFIASGNNMTPLKSTDGISWSSTNLSSNNYSTIVYTDGYYLAFWATSFYGDAGYSYSTNLSTWTYTLAKAAQTFPVGNNSGMIALPRARNEKELTGEFVQVSANAYTVQNYQKWISISSPSSCTLALPSAAANPNRELVIKQTASFSVVSASSNVLPLGSNTAGTAILSGSGKFANLVSNGQNWVIMQAN